MISETMNRFFLDEEDIAEKKVLAALCSHEYSVSEKTMAVAQFRRRIDRVMITVSGR